MTPELTAGILTFVLTMLAVLGTSAKLLPSILERRETAFEEKMKSQRADEDSARENQAKELELRVEEARSDAAILTAMSKNLEASTEALIASTKYSEVFQQRMSSNERALSENTEALGAIAEHFGVLLRTGSEPLQQLANRVKRIDEEGTLPLQRLQEGVNEANKALSEVHTAVMPPGQIITALTRIESEIEALKNALLVKISEATEVRRKTQPLPIIQKPETEQ